MAGKTPQTTSEVLAHLQAMRVMMLPDEQGRINDLDLRREETTDETLLLLDKVPGLKRLCLQDTHITNRGLANLSKLVDLEALDLRSCKKITDEGMQHVSKIGNLQEFELSDTQIGNAGLEYLGVLHNLDRLNIHSTQLTNEGLRFLKRFPKLTRLELGGKSGVTDQGFKHLACLKKLEWLVFSESPFTDAALAHLRDLTRLKLLYLAWTPINGSGFQHLAKLSRLENLHAVDTQFSDEGLKYLGALKNLKTVGLAGTKVTDKGLKYLEGLAKLKSLGLEGTQVTQQGKTALKKALPRCLINISAKKAEDLELDPDYLWTHPPRCIAGFTAKAMRDESPTTFLLVCKCGNEIGKFMGYALSSCVPRYSGPEQWVSPLGFLCNQCHNVTEVLDTDEHGYDAEIGSSSCNVRGKGKRRAFRCPKCSAEELSINVHFQYDGEEDLREDDPTASVEDFFGGFSAQGKCSQCRHKFSMAAFELA